MSFARLCATRALLVVGLVSGSPCALDLVESREALADELGRVAVVADSGLFARRVRAELASLGFEIVERVERSAGDPLTLRFRVLDAAAGVAEVFRGDVLVVSEGIQIDGGDAAVRVAEHLRAILQPLAEAARAPVQNAPEATNSKAETRVDGEPPIRRWLVSLDVGPSFGGATPGGTVVVGVAVAPGSTGRIRVGIDLGVPVIAEEIARSEGSTAVRQFFLAPALDFDVIRTRQARFELGLRAGGALTSFVGEAKPTYQASEATKVVAIAMLDARLAFAVGQHAEVSTGARLGSVFPGIDVRFAGASTETWGRPWLMPFVGGVARF